MATYYHVIKKHGVWHLYAGNAVASLMADANRGVIVRAARALARHDGAKVVVHREQPQDFSQDVGGPRNDPDTILRLRSSPISVMENLPTP